MFQKQLILQECLNILMLSSQSTKLSEPFLLVPHNRELLSIESFRIFREIRGYGQFLHIVSSNSAREQDHCILVHGPSPILLTMTEEFQVIQCSSLSSFSPLLLAFRSTEKSFRIRPESAPQRVLLGTNTRRMREECGVNVGGMRELFSVLRMQEYR